MVDQHRVVNRFCGAGHHQEAPVVAQVRQQHQERHQELDPAQNCRAVQSAIVNSRGQTRTAGIHSQPGLCLLVCSLPSELLRNEPFPKASLAPFPSKPTRTYGQ
jgi:hypothetical protein